MRILIAYWTKEGHTATIAKRLRDAVAEGGHAVTVRRVGGEPFTVGEDVDAVIVGGSVHAGKLDGALARFVRANRDRLGEIPSALFVVCLAAADPAPGATAEIDRIVSEFLGETDWQPDAQTAFAGCLAWSQYDFFTTLLMRLVLRKGGRPERHDRSHDHDFTDYEAVAAFGAAFADRLAPV